MRTEVRSAPRAPLADPRCARARPPDGRARRDDRQHRLPLRPGGARLLHAAASGSSPPTHWRSAPCCCSAAGSATCSAASGPSDRRPARLRDLPPLSAAPHASFEVLVGARALQGAFAALLAPAALSLLTTTFTDETERNKAFGVYGAVAGTGGGIGLLLGGVLTEYLVVARMHVREPAVRRPGSALARSRLLHNQRRRDRRPKLDIPGTLTASGGPVRARLRLLERRDGRLGRSGPDRDVRRRGRPAHGLRAGRSAGSRIRCCRCGLCSTATAAAPTDVAIAGIGMFGVFLFLTYYLQHDRSASRRSRPAWPSCR